MVTKTRIINIAITINLKHHFLSNGMQQNILFLANCINKIPGKNCFLLYFGQLKNSNLIDDKKCISYEEYYEKDNVSFDLIIYAGFNPGKKRHTIDKLRHKHTKFICIQYGNELTDDIYYSLNPKLKKKPKEEVGPLDQIWTSPHYKQNIPYLITKYKNKNIKIIPYLWDDIFIKRQFNDLNINESFQVFKSKIDISSVTIFEPNISFTKTSLIPINIVERFEQTNPKMLKRCNVICGKELTKNEFFPWLITNTDIYNKRKNFLKCHQRYPFLYSVYNWGGLVISNQILNELNYIYLESLYLSLPLIHNSKTLKNYGYYYESFDVIKAAKNIETILKDHKNNLLEYDKKNKILFNKFSPNNPKNINYYEELINNI